MVKPKKALGQNFLIDLSVVEDMVKALEIGQKDKIIEIGPGTGVVTKELLKNIGKGHITAVELDQELVQHLESLFQTDIAAEKLEVLHENILDYLRTTQTRGNFKIIGSLPYYITSPIFHKIIYMENQPDSVITLIQKEVAEKLVSKAPKNNYFSTFIHTFYTPEIVRIIGREAFDPIPKVDSAILKLVKNQNPQIKHENKKKYEGFLHRAYSSPRKKLNKTFTPEEQIIAKIDPNKRPQELDTAFWIEAFKKLVLT